MRESLLKFIWCPECHSELSLFAENLHSEIINGSLMCFKCHKAYPIVKGIPRFVDNGGYADSFGYEWNKLNWGRNEDEREFFQITDLSKEELKDKVVLDAGCGGGRFAQFVSKYCGEFVGFDYSDAVDKAYELCKENPNAHFIQCDINKNPFREGTFDLIYCHGVLHHTPNTKKSFENLPKLLKKDGILYVAVFGECALPFRIVDDTLRSVLNKLSHRELHKVCGIMTNMLYGTHRLVGRLMWFSLPWSKDVMAYVFYDWYSPKYHHRHSVSEVKGWFRESGLRDVKYINAYPYATPEQKYIEPTLHEKSHIWGTFIGVKGIKS